MPSFYFVFLVTKTGVAVLGFTGIKGESQGSFAKALVIA